jgi:hypothetical protein
LIIIIFPPLRFDDAIPEDNPAFLSIMNIQQTKAKEHNHRKQGAEQTYFLG